MLGDFIGLGLSGCDQLGIETPAVLTAKREVEGKVRVTAPPGVADYIVAPRASQASLVALLGELGGLDGATADGEPVVAEALRVREPEERLYYRGRWYDGLYPAAGATAADRAELAAFERAIDGWIAQQVDEQRSLEFFVDRIHHLFNFFGGGGDSHWRGSLYSPN